MTPSLRHLRVFLAVLDQGTITAAARACNISQPAASQALARLESEAGVALIHHGREAAGPTEAGRAYGLRVRRALGRLDAALTTLAPRLVLTATRAQLTALIAVRDAENFTLAAQRLGLSQPTVHRAVTQLESEAGRPLFHRAGKRMQPARAAQALADAARLCFRELEQAAAELAELSGREAGRIVIGAMPLSRSIVLPRVIAEFRRLRPTMPVAVLDGPYDDLLAGLRRGEIDLLIGALRDPAPVADVVQQALFTDDLVLVARPGHPLVGHAVPDLAALARHPWVLPPEGTPSRAHFERFMAPLPAGARPAIIESSSPILMRELLGMTDHIGCISRLQAGAEIALGALKPLAVRLPGSMRPIGITLRQDWLPTAAQDQVVAILRQVGQGLGQAAGLATGPSATAT
ncbi:MAG: LysR family transcriptional regulator [Rhodobacter sp.]|uniref:LysR family transcriptional regulator n=1 Tax=Pararhodobacter sp. TaxID=2127056 RepID=UPI001D1D1355|nr:LysR family transcriptional regulator [Pararhodobacter sp.]MCB1345819.1 LysR family transcriptional regulator [Paracoccaceae bacterium]MCC0074385.1 LysR family transcriptional regulator [Rhodobacter sp.]HPD91237.1 LysR family transcriptional regulator [Pararhodobacter sp.]